MIVKEQGMNSIQSKKNEYLCLSCLKKEGIYPKYINLIAQTSDKCNRCKKFNILFNENIAKLY